MQTDGSPRLETAPAERILQEIGPVGSDDLIPLLQAVQEEYGYLPKDVLDFLSSKTGIPTSRMYGVITFYAQFSLEPRGRHTVRCCSGTACHVRGSKGVREAVSKQLGIEEGATTEDRSFTLETVACLGTCFLAPVMMVEEQYYGLLTPERATAVLRTIS
jgi:NADH-quinone oxidoreductase subunit E